MNVWLRRIWITENPDAEPITWRRVLIAEGCRLMGLARSTYYDEPELQPMDA